MEINIINGEKTIVELIGRLDTAATPEAKAALYDIIHAKNSNTSPVLDFASCWKLRSR